MDLRNVRPSNNVVDTRPYIFTFTAYLGTQFNWRTWRWEYQMPHAYTRALTDWLSRTGMIWGLYYQYSGGAQSILVINGKVDGRWARGIAGTMLYYLTLVGYRVARYSVTTRLSSTR